MGNPATFSRITSLIDCLGREFDFTYKMLDEGTPGFDVGGCPRPYLEKVEQKIYNSNPIPIFRRTALSSTSERFFDALNRATTYDMTCHDYYTTLPNGLYSMSYNIRQITYPNGVRSEYQYSYPGPHPPAYIISQKFYRSGASSPFRTVGYSLSSWTKSAVEQFRSVNVNDGITLKKYYLDEAFNTDHEETYDAVTQKRLKKVQYSYQSVPVKPNGNTILEETVRPSQVITQFAKQDGSLGPGLVYDYRYDNCGNNFYLRDPNGTVTWTLYNGTDVMSLANLPSGIQKPQYFNAYTLIRKPATQAVFVTDPVHQTQKLRQTHYEYDGKGNLKTERVVQQTETGAIQYLDTKYNYDAFGNVTTKTDPKINVIQFEYGPQYNYAYLTRVCQGSGTLARYDYDYNTGLKTSATDPKGNVYYYEYDAIGRETKEYLSDSDLNVAITKTITYDDSNNKVTLGFGDQEGLITYDSLFGKPTLIQRKSNTSYVTIKESSYDSNGRLTWEKDGKQHTTYHSYDALDRETQTKFPDNTTMNYSHYWEGDCRIVTITDAKGQMKKQYFDLLDRLVGLGEHPEAGSTVSTWYTYDTAGNLIQSSNDRGIVSTNTYDNLGRLIRVDYPQDGANPMAPEIYVYDTAGNLSTKTTAKGTKVMEYEFNGGYRLSKVTEPDGREVTYTYDVNDNLVTQSTNGATYTYSGYDARNRAHNFTAQLDNAYTFNFTYNYDTYGRLTGITYPNRTNPVTYTYDELDRLLTIPGVVNSCSYDEDSKLTGMLYANGVNNTWDYDINDRPTNIGFGSVMNLGYGYDLVGNIIRINNDYYDYDGMNRLIWAGDSSTLRTGNGTAWGYDSAGNMTGKESYFGGISQERVGFTYDLANRLWSMGSKTYINDNAGNRTGKTDRDAWGYIYDGENRLTQVTKNGANILDSSYDGSGIRIKEVKGGQTTYFVYQGNNPLLEYTPVDGKCVYYIYAGNKRIAEEKDGAVKYYHPDHLGSVRAITDSNGNVTKRLFYDAYGNPLSCDNPQRLIKMLNGDVNGDGKTDLIQLYDSDGRLGIATYLSNGASHNYTWSNDDIGAGSGAGPFLTGDVNGDGKTDIIQLWNNNGRLAVITYLANGTGYTLAWGTNDIGAGSGAIKFLTGDVNGDGKTDIIQLWDNNGRLGAGTYLANGTGYTLAWGVNDIGAGSGAITFLTGDVNGDGKSDIIQLWDNNGRLGVVTYLANGIGYNLSWGVNDIGAGSSAINFLTGDVNGDGKTDIIQLWDNNGRLGVATHLSNGIGYDYAWGMADMGQGSPAKAYLAGEVNGDGKTDIIQLWDNNGRLAMITYLSNGNGYDCNWGTGDMGQGSPAVNYFAGDVNGDRKTDIVQLWYNSEQLGIINYVSSGVGYTCNWAGYLSAPDGSAGSDYCYTGKRLEQGSGLVYFGARFYDPETGRFLTVDPGRQGTNWYSYCFNNPLRYVDPDGQAATDSFWATTWKATMATAEVVGGGITTLGGAALMIGGSETVVGAVIGGVVTIHGANTFASGCADFYALFTGNDKGFGATNLLLDKIYKPALGAKAGSIVYTVVDIGASIKGTWGALKQVAGLSKTVINSTYVYVGNGLSGFVRECARTIVDAPNISQKIVAGSVVVRDGIIYYLDSKGTWYELKKDENKQ
ncbi:MAG TPA: RHS repeat-associated core domain-containing protein [Bacillota bacterium]|nr:RHS repeat-associated core domain-containing protein [Bacillota bacterium]